jgi:hypothetical protein
MFGFINNVMVKHKHHIIPRHAGGTDTPENLIDLTVAEHAEAHRLLFEKYGRWQDEVAWKALSGQIATAEINQIKNSERQRGEKNHMYGKPSPMRGKKHTPESKDKIKSARKKQIIVHSEETKRKIGDKHRGKLTPTHVKQAVAESNRRRTGLKHKPHKNIGSKQNITKCPHCNKEGGISSMYRWHFDNCKLKGLINE